MKQKIYTLAIILFSSIASLGQSFTLKPLFTFHGYDNKHAIDFSFDDKYLAISEKNGFVNIYDSATNQLSYKFQAQNSTVNCIQFHPITYILASGGSDGTLKLYDITNKKEILNIKAHDLAITAIAFSKSGDTIYTGSDDKTVKLWDVQTYKMVLEISSFKGKVKELIITPDNKKLIIGTSAITCEWVYEIPTYKNIYKDLLVIAGHVITQFGSQLITFYGTSGKKLFFQNLGNYTIDKVVELPGYIQNLSSSYDGNYIVYVYWDSNYKSHKITYDCKNNSVMSDEELDYSGHFNFSHKNYLIAGFADSTKGFVYNIKPFLEFYKKQNINDSIASPVDNVDNSISLAKSYYEKGISYLTPKENTTVTQTAYGTWTNTSYNVNYNLAITYFSKAIDTYPTPEAYFALGYANYQANAKKISFLDYFTKAINLKSDYIDAYYWRGMAQEWTFNDYNSAIEDFTKVISLDSNNTETYLQRGICYLNLNDLKNACPDICKAKEHNIYVKAYLKKCNNCK